MIQLYNEVTNYKLPRLQILFEDVFPGPSKLYSEHQFRTFNIKHFRANFNSQVGKRKEKVWIDNTEYIVEFWYSQKHLSSFAATKKAQYLLWSVKDALFKIILDQACCPELLALTEGGK